MNEISIIINIIIYNLYNKIYKIIRHNIYDTCIYVNI